MNSFSIYGALFKRNIFQNRLFIKSKNAFFSSGSTLKVEELFLNKEVQRILKKITGLDYEKVFAPRPCSLAPHTYEFATKERVKELHDVAAAKAKKKLQMPPVLEIRKPITDTVLSKDPELQGYIREKLVFTDLSSDVKNKDRVIVVCEKDGTLRKASWDERDRMLQTFFPVEGRNMETPKLYESPYLERLLDERSYEFVLNSTCLQFEPDHPEYHRITKLAYDHINKTRNFEILKSTRHFGPMAFYLACEKKIESLLRYMIEKLLIEDASHTIRLFYIIHSDLKPSIDLQNSKDLDILQDYIRNHASMKDELELTLQSFIEYQNQANLPEEKSSVSQA